MWSIQGAIVIRIVVAFVLTFALGFERQIRGSAAGDRTFSLIGVGTAVIGVLSAQGAPTIMTGAVTGVGFIGAGLLFRGPDAQIGVVHGMTTAAAVLAAAAIGAVAGEGELVLACLATAVVLLVLEFRYIPGVRLLDASRWQDRFRSDHDHGHLVAVQSTLTVVSDVPPGERVPPHDHGGGHTSRNRNGDNGHHDDVGRRVEFSPSTQAAAYGAAVSAAVQPDEARVPDIAEDAMSGTGSASSIDPRPCLQSMCARPVRRWRLGVLRRGPRSPRSGR